MHDRVLVNVKRVAVGGRRAGLWPGVPRAGPAVPAPSNVLKYQSLLLFALPCVCLSPARGTGFFLQGFTGWSCDLC